ncbi:hypothetical protein [Marimonas arenosa]|uniref:Uncharacterized protein n=1 Tax=Marimonas arenosa TaxID=1795305 RepID=A0AAE3WE16_9RHOB|nr:hypothetical protein [Marimonas arenosa]MDQ2090690.1 hypothetical protein [Marimonas arenosa]
MKVKKNTDHTLIAEDNPWLFGFMIIGFILVFSGVGVFLIADGEWMGLGFLAGGLLLAPIFFVIFVRRVQLVFYRPEGWAEIRRKNVFRQTATRYDLSEIRRAVVQTTSGDSGTLYRVALVVEKGGVEGDIPLTQAYSNVGDHRGVAQAINAWLGVSETELSDTA